MLKTISIITASSNSGEGCLETMFNSKELNLQARKDVKIRACYRKKAKADPVINIVGKGLFDIVEGIDAMKPATLVAAFKGVHSTMIVTPLADDHDFKNDALMVKNMINCAKDQGVKHIVLVASFTVNHPKDLSPISDRFLPCEALLDSFLADPSAPSFTVLRGGNFMTNFAFMFAPPKADTDNIIRIPNKSFPPVDPFDIGRLGAVVLVDSLDAEKCAIHKGVKYEVSGCEYTTPEEMVSIANEVFGYNKKLIDITPEDYAKQLPPSLRGPSLKMYSNPSMIPMSKCVEEVCGKYNNFRDFALRIKSRGL